MSALETRVRRLEKRTRDSSAPRPHKQAAEEARAIDAEIRTTDRELAAIGGPLDEEAQAFFESLDGLSLDEKIRALEEEIAREELEREEA
jgi:hypothetical protein